MAKATNPIAWVAKETKRLQRAGSNKQPFKVYRTKAWENYKRKFQRGSKKTSRKKVSGGGVGAVVKGRKTSVTYNVPTRPSGVLGSVSQYTSALRKIYEAKLGKLAAQMILAKTKADRRRISKELAQAKTDLKKYL